MKYKVRKFPTLRYDNPHADKKQSTQLKYLRYLLLQRVSTAIGHIQAKKFLKTHKFYTIFCTYYLFFDR